MLKFSTQSQLLVGFAAEKAVAGQTGVKICVKNRGITSDDPMFHICMKDIFSLFLSKTPIPLVCIHKFLIILHQDNTADIYINDFPESILVKVNQAIEVGQVVYRSNISDIKDLTFPEITIQRDDAIIYCCRTDWRFSLYFDFSRDIKLEILNKELGKLKKEAEFYSLIISTESELNRISTQNADAWILTEGKSDWKHLKKATARLDIQKDLFFFEDDKDRGATDLLKMCEYYAKIPQSKKFIFIFDRDDESVLKELKKKENPGDNYQNWGNNVYSLYLPIPSCRTEGSFSISIECFYSDEELTTKDKEGRRLYLSNEFDKISGNHLSEKSHCLELNKAKRDEVCVVDKKVFNYDNRNIALPKDDFAAYILNEDENYRDFNFQNFQKIFDVIQEIIDIQPEVE